MSLFNGDATPPALEPLGYHQALRDFLKRSDLEVWSWLSRRATDPKSADEIRFDLLKSTYRVDRDTQPALYTAAEEVAARLGITVPVTIYQAQNPHGLNASLAYVPGAVHLVLHGPIAAQLSPAEVRGLFAHELAHYHLWESFDGEILVAAEMLRALLNDPHAHSAHGASFRLLCLYNEIYCDRAAYLVTGDVLTVVSMLVKVETGVAEVNAESYLRQADEVFSHGPAAASELTHPEAFIRARAIKLWAADATTAASEIERMIEGAPGLDQIDLLEQQRISTATRRVVDVLLSHKWFQTDPVLAHARLFFDDYTQPEAPLVDHELARHVRVEPESLRDYYCFLLLDFVTADRDLEEAPLAAALAVAEQLGIKPRLVELARRELRLRKNQLEKIDDQKEAILLRADQELAATP